MSENDVARLGKSREEDYFVRAEAALLERFRDRLRRDAELKALGHYHGVEDVQVLEAFEAAGFDRDTVQVLHLVPIIQIAWADGAVSAQERSELLAIAEARDVRPGTAAYIRLVAWLDSPPPKDFFDRSLLLIAKLIEIFPEEKRVALRDDVMSTARAVAGASGGFLGIGSKVGAAEQGLLEHFAVGFERAHRAALAKQG